MMITAMGTRSIVLDFNPVSVTPPVKEHDIQQFIITTKYVNDRKVPVIIRYRTYAAYYLNNYLLDRDGGCDKCSDSSVDHSDGCPTTGWFYDESNFDYDNCYHPINSEVLEWAVIPQTYELSLERN